jgi:hypothetical protein
VLTELSWFWIAALVTVAPLIAIAVAFPLWQKEQMILGNVAGTAIIFAAAFALIARESVEIYTITQACLDAGTTCWPNPSAFTRYAVYAGIGLLEIFALFTYSLRVEQQIRNRRYAPEWR